jgi:hypothetical protein
MLLIRLFDGTVRREKRSQLFFAIVPSDKLQCPLCLKTYSLYGDKGYNSSGAVSFMQHLQRHEVAAAENPAKFWRENLKLFTGGENPRSFGAKIYNSSPDGKTRAVLTRKIFLTKKGNF